jgi:hypothetical protein
LLRENQNRQALRDKLEPDYLAVMPGKTQLPSTMKEAVGDLAKTLRIIKAEKTGVGADQESVSAKMTLVLQALNNCSKTTNLNVESVKISGTKITLSGTTSSRSKTNEVFDEMVKQGLEIGNQAVGDDGKFSVTVTIKEQPPRA